MKIPKGIKDTVWIIGVISLTGLLFAVFGPILCKIFALSMNFWMGV